MEFHVIMECVLGVIYVLLGFGLLLLGILLHKIGTIRKWQIEEEQAALRFDQQEVMDNA